MEDRFFRERLWSGVMLRMAARGFHFSTHLTNEYLAREAIWASIIREEADIELGRLALVHLSLRSAAHAIRGVDAPLLNDQINEVRNILFGSIAPWRDWGPWKPTQNEVDALKARWEAQFGKLESAEVEKDLRRMETFTEAAE